MGIEQKNAFSLNVIGIKATSESAYESDLRIIAQKATKGDLVLYFGRDEFLDSAATLS